MTTTMSSPRSRAASWARSSNLQMISPRFWSCPLPSSPRTGMARTGRTRLVPGVTPAPAASVTAARARSTTSSAGSSVPSLTLTNQTGRPSAPDLALRPASRVAGAGRGRRVRAPDAIQALSGSHGPWARSPRRARPTPDGRAPRTDGLPAGPAASFSVVEVDRTVPRPARFTHHRITRRRSRPAGTP